MVESIGGGEKFKQCLNCGAIVPDNDRIKFCIKCVPIMEKIANQIRCERYREKNRERIREQQKRWVHQHPEQKRLISRNYMYRHMEEQKIKLKKWREKNPDKVREQNKRARKSAKRREIKNLYMVDGKYKPLKIHVTCPKCKHRWPTMAKRPQCSCGYSFPRGHYAFLLDALPTKPCKCCGREVPSYGRGMPRQYCECCLPQITALKRVLNQMRNGDKNPERCRDWYQKTKEIVVAVTCVFCDDIILGKRAKRICEKCQQKWYGTIPRSVKEILKNIGSVSEITKDILIWKRIYDARRAGHTLE